ncbi:unnamed protein product [Rotaria sp. Silwood2]|nr:unnamed protein product [Rotaria sp. Silwood2]CAF4324680.1 unnamed protein product [Rotaria sp. Silwood2]
MGIIANSYVLYEAFEFFGITDGDLIIISGVVLCMGDITIEFSFAIILSGDLISCCFFSLSFSIGSNTLNECCFSFFVCFSFENGDEFTESPTRGELTFLGDSARLATTGGGIGGQSLRFRVFVFSWCCFWQPFIKYF